MNTPRDAMSIEVGDSVFGVSLNPMSYILQTSGFDTTAHGTLRGISGALQSFDLIARKEDKTIAIDILPAGDSKRSEMALVNMRAKIWDCAPDFAIAVAPVKSSSVIKDMSQLYKLTLVEADNQQELEEEFTRQLGLCLGKV